MRVAAVKENPPVRPRVLLTGASGFIGRALGLALLEAGFAIRELGRRPGLPASEFLAADLAAPVDWPAALAGVDYVVHAAGMAHVPAEGLSARDLETVRRVNALAAAELAAAAARAGVRRLVFISTAKVLGEAASLEAPFGADSPPAPADAYARIKLEAERRIAAVERLPWVILRPPLVYGPGVKGNFARLFSWVRRGLPLPLGSIDNRRSLLYVGNLADAVLASLRREEAAGRHFLLCDEIPVSTPQLLREMAQVAGCRLKLLPVPPAILVAAAAAAGRKADWVRLAGSFVIDAGAAASCLGWSPRLALREGLGQSFGGGNFPSPDRLEH